MAIGVPGWPELAAWTASIARVRMVLMHFRSSGGAAVMSPPDAEAKVAKRPAGQWVVNQPGDSGNGKVDETGPGSTFPPPKCVLDSPQGAGQAGQRGVGDPPHAQRRARTSMSSIEKIHGRIF